MARRVANVRLGLSIPAGWHVRNPRTVPHAARTATPPTKRVALVPEPPAGQTDPQDRWHEPYMPLVKLRVQIKTV